MSHAPRTVSLFSDSDDEFVISTPSDDEIVVATPDKTPAMLNNTIHNLNIQLATQKIETQILKDENAALRGEVTSMAAKMEHVLALQRNMLVTQQNMLVTQQTQAMNFTAQQGHVASLDKLISRKTEAIDCKIAALCGEVEGVKEDANKAKDDGQMMPASGSSPTPPPAQDGNRIGILEMLCARLQRKLDDVEDLSRGLRNSTMWKVMRVEDEVDYQAYKAAKLEAKLKNDLNDNLEDMKAKILSMEDAAAYQAETITDLRYELDYVKFATSSPDPPAAVSASSNKLNKLISSFVSKRVKELRLEIADGIAGELVDGFRVWGKHPADEDVRKLLRALKNVEMDAVDGIVDRMMQEFVCQLRNEMMFTGHAAAMGNEHDLTEQDMTIRQEAVAGLTRLKAQWSKVLSRNSANAASGAAGSSGSW